MELIPITSQYYEFVRELRTDPKNTNGFLEEANITPQQQKEYMKKYSDCYYICLLYGEPVGYIGVIDNDIRVCTDSSFHGNGIGKFMLSEIRSIFPDCRGRIKEENMASRRIFEACQVPYDLI